MTGRKNSHDLNYQHQHNHHHLNNNNTIANDYGQCISQRCKSITFSLRHQQGSNDRTRSAASTHSVDNNSVSWSEVWSNLSVYSVTRYVNQAVHQVSYGGNQQPYHAHHNYCHNGQVQSKRSFTRRHGLTICTVQRIEQKQRQYLMQANQRSVQSKSRIRTRFAAVHKKMYSGQWKVDVHHFPSASKVLVSETSVKVELSATMVIVYCGVQFWYVTLIHGWGVESMW